MKSPWTLIKGAAFAAIALACSVQLQAATLWMNDFESGLGSINGAPTGVSYSVVASPGGRPGNALLVTDTGATNFEYSEVRSGTTSGVFAITTTGNPAIGNSFSLDFDVFIPADSVATHMTIVVRLRTSSDATNPNAFMDFSLGSTPGNPALSPIAAGVKDQWLDVTINGVIPATFTHGGEVFTTTSITPIIAWRQTGDRTAAGTFGYLDNISFNVVPEPSKALLALLGFGFIAFRRRR